MEKRNVKNSNCDGGLPRYRRGCRRAPCKGRLYRCGELCRQRGRSLRARQGNQVAGGQAVSVQADVSKVADVSRLFDAAEKQLGAVDGLVNNAGIMALAGLAPATSELFD